MKPKKINVLADVFKLISADKEVLKTPKVLTAKLKEKGINEKELCGALMWLVSFFTYDKAQYDIVPANRILTSREIERLGEKGYDFIANLTSQGILSPGRREFLLDKLMSIESEPLEFKQLKLLTFISITNDMERKEEIKWIEAVVLKESPDTATLLH